MVRDTSLEAYIGLNENGKAVTQRGTIYKYIKSCKRPITRQELSKATHIPINAVCGRVNELIKMNAISESDKRICRVTGSNVYTLTA